MSAFVCLSDNCQLRSRPIAQCMLLISGQACMLVPLDPHLPRRIGHVQTFEMDDLKMNKNTKIKLLLAFG